MESIPIAKLNLTHIILISLDQNENSRYKIYTKKRSIKLDSMLPLNDYFINNSVQSIMNILT